MRWDDFRRSDRVVDRRGDAAGGRGVPGGRTGVGIGTVVVLSLVGWALGIDPRLLIGGAEMVSGGKQTTQAPPSTSTEGTPSDQMGQFVAAVLGETEDRWNEIFQRSGKTYRAPALVMFAGATQSACGS